MKYLIQIYSNPESRAMWESFSAEQQAEGYAYYQGISDELALERRAPRERGARRHLARQARHPQRRRHGRERRPVRRDEGAARRLLPRRRARARRVRSRSPARFPEAEFGLIEVRPVLEMAARRRRLRCPATSGTSTRRRPGTARRRTVGARGARSALRRLRGVRGRHAGGAHRGIRPVAARGRPRQPARVARAGRVAALHRPGASRMSRAVAARRSPSTSSRRADADPGGRRHADAVPALLPPGAGAGPHRSRSRCAPSADSRPPRSPARCCVPEATVAQRISRAKARIRASGEGFRMPRPDELDARLAALRNVLYLIFTEGHTASSGECARSRRPVGRGDPPHAAAARRGTGCLGRDDRAARAHAAHRGPPGRPHRRGGRARAARRAGPLPLGPRDDRRGRRARHRGARPRADRARTSCRPRSPPCTTRPPRPRRPTGSRSSASTTCSSGSRPARW